MSNRIIAALVVLGLILIVLTYLLWDKASTQEKGQLPSSAKKVPLPIPKVEEYIKDFNEGLKESQTKKKERKENKTSEINAAEKAFVKKVLKLSESAVQDITFYGKVIDQNGAPVSGARVTYIAQGETYAKGSGTQYTETDADGLFVAKDIKGAAFVVQSFEKDGYQFPPRQRFLSNYGHAREGLLWEDYSTENNSYLFNAWKVAGSKYPKTSQAEAVFGFKPGKIYSLDFSTSDKRKVKKEAVLDSDLQVLFSRNDSNWGLTLTVPNGGLIESTGLYMNMAPESGYISTVNFEGTSDDRAIIKKYYIHSRGKLYGRLDFEIIPYYRKKSAIVTTYIMNLEGGRNLEVE